MDATVAQARTAPFDESSGASVANAWSERVATLQELANDSARFLAAFDIRKAQNSINALSDAVGVARAAIVPRKKFSFSKRAAANSESVGTTATAASVAPERTDPPLCTPTVSNANFEEDEYSIEDLTGETVIIESGAFTLQGREAVKTLEAEIAAETASKGAAPAALVASLRRARALAGGRDVRIQRCTDCTFVLLDVLRAVRADSLVRCRVLTSAVAGSLLLHGATDCTFVIAARQFRLHTSTRCDFFIRSRSHPIIEDCSGFRFAPYPLVGNQLDKDLRESDLDPRAASSGLWRAVDDFKWHKAQHSPNWRELAAGERMSIKDTLVPAAAAAREVSIDQALLMEGAAPAADEKTVGANSIMPAAPTVGAPGAASPDDDEL